MAWTVEVKTSAAKEIERLDKPVQRRIDAFLRQIEACDDPRQLLDPYAGPLAGCWKKRIGDYRLICEIADRVLTVYVLRVGHRSKLYP